MTHLHACLVLLLAGGLAAQQPAPGPTWSPKLRDCSLELRATWERVTDTVYHFEKRYALIRDLAPARERERHDAERFRAILPETAVAVGDTWRIDPERVLPFLRQFHAGATAELHHDGGLGLGAHGAFGCLRALGEGHAEVQFRAHAEFVIAGDGRRGVSSWFTPAQFRGRLLIDRRRGEVVAFRLEVPAQSANVDLNIAEGDRVVADIGRVPRMELTGGDFPEWTPAASLTEGEADQLLARKFYPFAEITWLDLAPACAESRRSGKPLHVIALFGSLLDESC